MERWRGRSSVAVVVSVSVRPDGTLRLVLGDVVQEGAGRWRDDALITYRDFGRQEFSDVEVSEEVLGDIGLTLVARLAALMKSSGM